MTINPKQLFLLDGIGAVVSALFLGVILPSFDAYFTMPLEVLYFLAVIPCFFAVYSLLCFLIFPKGWRPYLKAIAIANILYAIVSATMLYYFRDQLTSYDWIYFILELLILGFIVRLELKVANYS